MAFDRDSGPWRSVGGANGPESSAEDRTAEQCGADEAPKLM